MAIFPGLFGRGLDPEEEEHRRQDEAFRAQIAAFHVKQDSEAIERSNRDREFSAQISSYRPKPPATEREIEKQDKDFDNQLDAFIITDIRKKRAAERNERTPFSNLTEPEIARKVQELSGIFLPQAVKPRDYPNIPTDDPTLFVGRTPAELKILDLQFKEAEGAGTNEQFVPGPNLQERVKLQLAKRDLDRFKKETTRNLAARIPVKAKPITEENKKVLRDADIYTPGEGTRVFFKNIPTALPQIGMAYQTILAGGQDVDQVGDNIASVLEASGVKGVKKSLKEYREFQEERGTAKFIKETFGEEDEVVARNQWYAVGGQAVGALLLAPVNAQLVGASTAARRAALAGIQNTFETLPINLIEAANSGDESAFERITTLALRQGIAGAAGAGFSALRTGETVGKKRKMPVRPPEPPPKTTGGYVSEIDGKGFDGKVRVPEGKDHIFLDNINKTDPSGPPVGRDIAKAISKEMVTAGRVKVKSSITSDTPEKVVAIERQAQKIAAEELGVELPPMTKTQIDAVNRGIRRIVEEKGVGSPEAAKTRKLLLEKPVPRKGEQTIDRNVDDAVAEATGFPRAGGGEVVRPVRDPVTGALPKKIGNINVEKIAAPDKAIQAIQDTQSIFGLDILIARGRKRGWKEVNTKAQDILNDPFKLKRLLSKKLGSVYTDAEGFALREVFVHQAIRLSEAAEKMGRLLEGSPERAAALKELADAEGALITLQGKASSGAAEAGRSLNALKMISSGKAAQIQGLDLDHFAKLVRGMDSPEQIGRFARSISPTWNQKIHEAWIWATTSLSDSANIGGNAAMGVWNAANKAVEGGIDLAVSLGGARRGREAFIDESIPFIQMTGAMDGLKYGWDHIRTLEAQGPSRVGSKFTHREANQGTWADWMRRLSTGRLSAQDEVAGHMGFAGELKASAMRAAHKEKLTGKAFNDRVTEIRNSNLSDPDNKNHWIWQKAMGTSQKVTFMNETVLSEAAAALLKSKAGPYWMWGAPFQRVSSAVVTEFAKGSPFGFFYGGYRVAKGDFAGEAFAKPVTGAMVGMTAIWMAKMGLLTGSSKQDQAERETLGPVLPPNSIRVGGKWVSLDKFEIPGQILGLYVDSAAALENGDIDRAEKISLVVRGLTSRIKEGSFARGIGTILQSMEGDMGRSPEKWAAHMLSNFSPRLVSRPLGQFTGAATAKPEGFLQEIEKGIGLNVSGVKQKQGVFGRSLDADKTLMDKLWAGVGIRTQDVKDDPVLKERIRLGVPIKRIDTPSGIDAKTGLNEKELFENLSAEDTATYYLSKGGFMRSVDEAVLGHRRYKSLSEDEKATVFRRARSQSASAHDKAWRKADRTFFPAHLKKRIDRISVRRLVVQVMKLRGITLDEAKLEKLGPESEALRLMFP